MSSPGSKRKADFRGSVKQPKGSTDIELAKRGALTLLAIPTGTEQPRYLTATHITKELERPEISLPSVSDPRKTVLYKNHFRSTPETARAAIQALQSEDEPLISNDNQGLTITQKGKDSLAALNRDQPIELKEARMGYDLSAPGTGKHYRQGEQTR